MSAWAAAHAPPEEKQRRAEELMRKARERREEEIRAELREKIAAGVAAKAKTWRKGPVHGIVTSSDVEDLAARIRAGEFG